MFGKHSINHLALYFKSKLRKKKKKKEKRWNDLPGSATQGGTCQVKCINLVFDKPRHVAG